MHFTKTKFLMMESKKQNKKCAEILKKIYEELIQGRDPAALKNHYLELISWLEMPPIEFTVQSVADRYHDHLKFAEMSLKEHNFLPRVRKFDSQAKEPFLDNAVYLDGVRSAYNIGNMLRTLEALRIGRLYFSKNTPFINNGKIQKTSMDSYREVPASVCEDIRQLPRPFIALETSDEAISLTEFIFPEKFTIVFGNEEYGISDAVLKEIDYILEIPMRGFKNSINVASAFAITAFEIKRQITNGKNLKALQ